MGGEKCGWENQNCMRVPPQGRKHALRGEGGSRCRVRPVWGPLSTPRRGGWAAAGPRSVTPPSPGLEAVRSPGEVGSHTPTAGEQAGG